MQKKVNLSFIEKTAVSAALSAGAIIYKNRFNISKISYKDNKKSILTNIDLQAEKIIIQYIKKHFPHHSILSEEKGSIEKNSQVQWIIDPLDGTANYSQAIPFYCVSIAVSIDGIIKLGVIYDPIHQELFIAEQSRGARLNNKKIAVSTTKKLNDALSGYGFGVGGKINKNFATLHQATRKTRVLGSTALALCYVACGRLDIYSIDSINVWDIAAGTFIAKQAGAHVFGFNTQTQDNQRNKKITNLIVSNEYLHRQIAKKIKDG